MQTVNLVLASHIKISNGQIQKFAMTKDKIFHTPKKYAFLQFYISFSYLFLICLTYVTGI